MNPININLIALFALIFCTLSCEKSRLVSTSDSHMLWSANAHVPCIALEYAGQNITFLLDNKPYCVDSTYFEKQSKCLFWRNSLLQLASGVPESYTGSSMPNIAICFKNNGMSRTGYLDSLSTLVNLNLLAAPNSFLFAPDLILWYSNRSLCDMTGTQDPISTLPQVFKSSPFLSEPFGENAFFTITKMQPSTADSSLILLDFLFSLDLFDQQHRVLRIRNGAGKAYFYMPEN